MGKWDAIVNTIKNTILPMYSTKLTLRQVYYRLVAMALIQNTNSQYTYLSKVLVDARKNGTISADLFEDRTRSFYANTDTHYWFWKEKVEHYTRPSSILSPVYSSIGQNIYQDKITMIVLEKQALESVFKQVCNSMTILVVNRGYNSYTQLHELAKAYKNDPREINVYTFGDYDPSGFDIVRNFKEQAQSMGITFNKVKDIALTEKQILDNALPPAPAKKSDTRTEKWIAERKAKGEIHQVVELDALDPNLLVDLIKKCTKKNWNKEAEKRRKKLNKVVEYRSKKEYYRQFIKNVDGLKEEAKRQLEQLKKRRIF